MNYYIDIYDTTSDAHTPVLENAAADSIILKWEGKDAIDELDVVGSSLGFTLEAKHNLNDDGAFIHLFTGNEVKYRIDLRLESDDSLVWQGFLLPDSYTEPYKTGNFFIDLQATDGLGRLKGKYLPDSYYTEEKSVIDIISTCLSLTGLQFDIVFAPGIDNKVEKDWQNIYIDGLNYVDNDRKWTAYKILQTFLQDTLSCLYQHKAVWYVEGLNKRNLLEYTSKKYTYAGVFISNFTVEKEVKNIDGKILGSGNVTMVPPYNNITVTHTAKALQLPETIATEENDGWVTEAAGVIGTIYATDWYAAHPFFWAKAKAPDYKLWLEGNNSATVDYNKYIQLKQKIYVKQDTKLKFTLELKIDYYGTENTSTIESLIEDGDWTNPIYYKIQVNGETLFTNVGTGVSTAETIQFDDDKEARIAFEFIIPESGLLDVIIYQPYGTRSASKISGIFIENIELEHIGFEEDVVYTDTINENYTIDKEHDLVFADDVTGLSKCFLLGKLREDNLGLFQLIPVYIVSGFTQNGNNYSVVSLEGANLIADNIDSVYKDAVLLENLEVIYNYSGGEQMVIKTETLYEDGAFGVYVYKIKDFTDNRDKWEQWTDSVYEIERKRFPEAVLGVFSRLFENPIPKVEATVNEIVLFGELVQWYYLGETLTYVPTNCSYNIDDGKTTIVASQATYLQSNALVPPYVDAGPDIFLYDDESSVSFDATAYDPDGTIVSYAWVKLSGDSGDTITTPAAEDTTVTGLTGNEYEYQITVTDNDGLTASDTVKVIRVVNYTLNLTLVDSNNDSEGWDDRQYRKYSISTTPTLPADVVMLIDVISQLSYIRFKIVGTFEAGEASITIEKNGATLETYTVEFGNTDDITTYDEDNPTTFSYIDGDVIYIYLEAALDFIPVFGSPEYTVEVNADFTADFASLVGIPGTVSGPPITVSAQADLTA